MPFARLVRRPLHLVAAMAAVFAVLLLSSGLAAADQTTRVSLDGAGMEVTGDNLVPSISGDGRYVAFESTADDLVLGDTNNLSDIFVRDRMLGTIERVSVDSSEVQALGGNSFTPAISDDGNFVAFYSTATNLVASDTNGFGDIFVRDRVAGTTERVSVDSNEVQGENGDSYSVDISADGQFVAFDSDADNLVPGDTNFWTDVFVRDRTAGTTERVSVDSSENGTTDCCGSFSPAISGNGQFVVFDSSSEELTADDTNGWSDIFLRDRTAGTTTRITLNIFDPLIRPHDGGSFGAAISANGQFIGYDSAASVLIADDTNGITDVFLHDRTGGTTERVNVDSAENQVLVGVSFEPSISSDGRFVAFESGSAGLVPDDTNGQWDVFLRDRTLGTTERASVTSAGAEVTGGVSWDASISADGMFVAFESASDNVVTGDGNTASDAFVHSYDDDGDLVHEHDDNCPDWANPGQGLPVWPVPAGDSDCDGFTDTREQFLGTDREQHCNVTTTANDEADDMWPPDMNDNRFTTLADVLLFGPTYNKLEVNNDGYNKRFDLNQNGSVTLADIITMGPYYNKSCA